MVVGLDPIFFATSAKVQLFDRPELLKGETLYISLPLSRVLTLEEIVAVLGHELGHFRGNDTIYSLRFVPLYAGMGSSIDSLSAAGRSATLFHLMVLPASAVIGFMLGLFAKNERKASRIRELAADQASLEVAPLGAFGPALVKSAIFSQLWGPCLAEDANRLEAGLVTRNPQFWYSANLVRYDLDREKISESMDELLKSHPSPIRPTAIRRSPSA